MCERSFCSAFEYRYRGTRTLIKRRLGVYLPFVEFLLQLHNQCRALDFGCGLGEWLQLLQEYGIEAKGVDLDEAMVDICDELDHPVVQEDIIRHLKSIENESLSIVSGFHIAEYLVFSDLQALITESVRMLKPRDLLILETPNPENISVGTMNFHLDPTHTKQLPSTLLTFLAEHHGFTKVKILRLQELSDLLEKPVVKLIDVWGEVSPDFSVIAQKQPSASVLEQFSSIFNTEYGITLGQLTEGYDASTGHRLGVLEQRIIGLEKKSLELPEVLNRLARAEAAIAQQARQLADMAERSTTIESRFVVTKQQAASLGAKTAELNRSLLKKVARYPLAFVIKVALNRPGLSKKVIQLLVHCPGLHNRFRSKTRELEVWKDGDSKHFSESGHQLAVLCPQTRPVYK